MARDSILECESSFLEVRTLTLKRMGIVRDYGAGRAAGPMWNRLPSRQQVMNMLKAADMPEKHGQRVD